MKKLLLCLTAIFSITAYSQVSIQITEQGNPVAANGTVSAVTTANGNTKLYFDVKNISASTQSYVAKRYDILLHTAASTTADAYFCFAGSCYTSQTFSAGTLVLGPGQSAGSSTVAFNMLIADLDEAATVGQSIVKYTFKNVSNAADSLQLTASYNGPVGIKEMSNVISSFELSPNPVNETATIKINSAKSVEGKLVIINALGAVVNEKSISLAEGKNKIEFSAETLQSGIYFVSVKFANSSLTKKFIVK